MGAERISLAAKLTRGDLFVPDCPSREIMRHVTSSWGVLVLIALQAGTHRFSELRRKVAGVSERMLSQTLRALEGDGLVMRRSFPVVPPHVEYSLTPLGVEAAVRVAALADWIEENVETLATPSGSVARAAAGRMSSLTVAPRPASKRPSSARASSSARR